MQDIEAWARMLLALERHTDDIAGERAAVLEWAADHLSQPKGQLSE